MNNTTEYYLLTFQKIGPFLVFYKIFKSATDGWGIEDTKFRIKGYVYTSLIWGSRNNWPWDARKY